MVLQQMKRFRPLICATSPNLLRKIKAEQIKKVTFFLNKGVVNVNRRCYNNKDETQVPYGNENDTD